MLENQTWGLTVPLAPTIGVEGRSRSSDRSSRWKIELKIQTSKAEKTWWGWSRGVGRRRKWEGSSFFRSRRWKMRSWVKDRGFYILQNRKIEELHQSSKDPSPIPEEVAPLSVPFFEAEDRRWAALFDLRGRRSKIEDCRRFFVLPLRRSKMTNYSKMKLFEDLGCSSKMEKNWSKIKKEKKRKKNIRT